MGGLETLGHQNRGSQPHHPWESPGQLCEMLRPWPTQRACLRHGLHPGLICSPAWGLTQGLTRTGHYIKATTTKTTTLNTTPQARGEKEFFFQVLKILSGNSFQQCAAVGSPLDSRAPLSLPQKVHIYQNQNGFIKQAHVLRQETRASP